MKTYNVKLIEASDKIVRNSLNKSKATVEKLTAPSGKAAKIGRRIGSLIGVGLVISGIIKLLLGGGIWAIASLVAGVTTIVSNNISPKE